MPSRGPKPSEIAVEAKRYYIPKIEQCLPDLPARSFAYSEVDDVSPRLRRDTNRRLRIAVLDADAVDVALQWNHEERRHKTQDHGYPVPPDELRIPLIIPVDEKRAGGDWESGSMAPEEALSRRSNFVRCLARSRAASNDTQSYPIPSKGGIYSPQVVVFRSGSNDNYTVWDISRWTWLPIISVAPGRRPKLTPSGQDYTFSQERDLMHDKIRIALRLAAAWGHRDICVGPFGFGPGFRNPARQLATMWKHILFEEEEFCDAFSNVVFAIEDQMPTSAVSASSGSSGLAAGASSSSNTITPLAGSAASISGSSVGGMSDYEIFKEEFDPSNLCKISFGKG